MLVGFTAIHYSSSLCSHFKYQSIGKGDTKTYIIPQCVIKPNVAFFFPFTPAAYFFLFALHYGDNLKGLILFFTM